MVYIHFNLLLLKWVGPLFHHLLFVFVILLPLGDSVDSHFVFIVSSHHLGLPWWRLQARRSS